MKSSPEYNLSLYWSMYSAAPSTLEKWGGMSTTSSNCDIITWTDWDEIYIMFLKLLIDIWLWTIHLMIDCRVAGQDIPSIMQLSSSDHVSQIREMLEVQ